MVVKHRSNLHASFALGIGTETTARFDACLSENAVDLPRHVGELWVT